MKISIVCAMDSKRGIGKNNKIPWHIKEDLVHLKGLTAGHIVILGRKSYESMDFYYNKTGRPMPGKLYIVVTRDKNYKPDRENAVAAYSIDDAVAKAKQEDEEAFVIGGQQIFEQTIDIADKLYLTIVNGDFNCDAFFPDYSMFKKVISEESKESGEYKYKFLELEK